MADFQVLMLGLIDAPWWPPVWGLVWILVKIFAIVLPLLGAVAYTTLWERKLIGWMHVRLGPNRVGPLGLLQPIADALKLLSKEVISPSQADTALFFLAPAVVMAPALAAWAVIPFAPGYVLADINAGLLYVMAITSLGVYGVIIAGWASNSKYAFLGALRASAQMVSYELAMGFVLVSVLLVSGSMNMSTIVNVQNSGWFADRGLTFLSWNWLPLLPLFGIYVISATAETNRHPFDVVEGESEIVAGHMIEYSGMGFALFFLGEYANMILLSTMAAIMFLGGWAAPIDLGLAANALGFGGLATPPWWHDGLANWFWLFAKIFGGLSMYIWMRAAFPRYRYDQIMRLGWKIFIPVTLAWLVVVAVWMQTPWNIWPAAVAGEPQSNAAAQAPLLPSAPLPPAAPAALAAPGGPAPGPAPGPTPDPARGPAQIPAPASEPARAPENR